MKIAKKLKKNNVAVDVVSLAAEEENTAKLEGFQASSPLQSGIAHLTLCLFGHDPQLLQH